MRVFVPRGHASCQRASPLNPPSSPLPFSAFLARPPLPLPFPHTGRQNEHKTPQRISEGAAGPEGEAAQSRTVRGGGGHMGSGFRICGIRLRYTLLRPREEADARRLTMRPENLASSHAVKRAARSPQLLALPGTTSRPARPAVWYKCARRCQSSAAMLLICARMRCGCSSRSQHTYTSHAGTHALARTRARSDTHKTLLRSLTEALSLSFTCKRSLTVLILIKYTSQSEHY